MFKNPVVAFYLIVTIGLILLGSALYSFRLSTNRTGRSFSIFLLTLTANTFMELFTIVSMDNLPLWALSRRISIAFFFAFIPYVLLQFTWSFSSQNASMPKRKLQLLQTYVIFVVGLLLTNPAHDLMLRSGFFSPTAPIDIISASGPLLFPSIVAAFLMYGLSLRMLIRVALKSDGLFRKQSIFLTGAILIPLIVSTLQIYSNNVNLVFSPTIIGFCLCGIISTFVLFKLNLNNVIPFARI